MEKRNLLIIIIIFAVITLTGMGTHKYYQQEVGEATVTLIIDYGGLKENDVYENVKIQKNSTVLDLLNKETDVATEDTQYGKMVISINGVSQDKDKGLWWTYTVNGKVAETGAETKILNDGDVIQWNLTKF